MSHFLGIAYGVSSPFVEQQKKEMNESRNSLFDDILFFYKSDLLIKCNI